MERDSQQNHLTRQFAGVAIELIIVVQNGNQTTSRMFASEFQLIEWLFVPSKDTRRLSYQPQ